MRKPLALFLLLVTLAFIYQGCGPSGEESVCSANFTGSGLSLFVDHIQDTSYRFTLCENSQPPGAVYSIFGVNKESSLSALDPTSSARESHLGDASDAGDQYQVTFENTDIWFAVYEDEESGGSFIHSTSNELIRGDLSLIPLNESIE